jgi:hypothetical protein
MNSIADASKLTEHPAWVQVAEKATKWLAAG